MTQSAEPSRSEAARLTPPELLVELRGRHRGKSERRSALLVVHLNRSDRLHALAQQPYAKQVLVEAAKRIESLLRPNDRYAIVSPDEIWVLLSDLPSEALAEMASRSLRENLVKPVSVTRDGETMIVQLRPVVGGGWAPGGSIADPMTLVNTAHESAIRARNNDEYVQLTKLDSDAAILHRDTLERELRAALFGNELDVHFQPQIDMKSGACVAAEALIRWFREDGKSVNPGLVASICEERGMMAQLTQYVLNTSLRNLMFWRGQDIDISVGVNLSAVTLADNSFPDLVEQSLATWGIPGDKLLLELTESTIVQHEVGAVDFMRRLKAHGCKLAIDDFGTGHSSFSYLRQFPLDELKIDQSFVRDITTDKGDRQIVGALIGLAHTFEMHALAEGIESSQAIDVLNELGCDRAQGFYYAKPMAAEDFVQWYQKHHAETLATEDP